MFKNSLEFPSDLSPINQCRRSFEHRSVVDEYHQPLGCGATVKEVPLDISLFFSEDINSSFSSMVDNPSA